MAGNMSAKVVYSCTGSHSIIVDIVYTLVTAEVYQLCVLLLCSPRAAHFNALAGSNLADWITSIGLEAYADIISQLVGTGERLASISSNVEDLQVWKHVLHCDQHLHLLLCLCSVLVL